MPNDSEFQLGVLRALLDLFSRPSGPVLEDYDVDTPQASGSEEAWSCVIPLPPLDEAQDPREALKQSLTLEVTSLMPWYQESGRVNGRTTFGLSGLAADDIPSIASFIGDIASGNDSKVPQPLADRMTDGVRYLFDDVKAFYMEAAAAQPGAHPPGGARMWEWFYHETRMGQALYDVRDQLRAEYDSKTKENGGVRPAGPAPVNPIPQTYDARLNKSNK